MLELQDLHITYRSEGGPVPDGATITKATLSLYKYSYYDTKYQLRPVLVNWVQNEVTWSQSRQGVPWTGPGATGQGSDIAATYDAVGDALWTPGWLAFGVGPFENPCLGLVVEAPAARQPAAERLAGQQLHDDVGHGTFVPVGAHLDVFAGVEHPDDGRVSHARGRLSLETEPCPERGVPGEVGLEDLDRHRPPERLVVAAVDAGHTAATDEVVDTVASGEDARLSGHGGTPGVVGGSCSSVRQREALGSGVGVLPPVIAAVASPDWTVRSVPEQLTVYVTFSVWPGELLTWSWALRASGANDDVD